MDYTDEKGAKLKEEMYAARAAAENQAKTCGEKTMGLSDLIKQTSLWERINNRLDNAELETRHGMRTRDRLSELKLLIQKHPDVLRIIELLDIDVRL